MRKKKNIVRYTARQIKKMARKADLSKLESMTDEDIDFSDIPPIDDEFWRNAIVVRAPKKRSVTLRLDDDVLAYFKKKIGKGYQTFINDLLRSYAETHKPA